MGCAARNLCPGQAEPALENVTTCLRCAHKHTLLFATWQGFYMPENFDAVHAPFLTEAVVIEAAAAFEAAEEASSAAST